MQKMQRRDFSLLSPLLTLMLQLILAVKSNMLLNVVLQRCWNMQGKSLILSEQLGLNVIPHFQVIIKMIVMLCHAS
jgi:hypothetical protein